jgi:hypothetical protein
MTYDEIVVALKKRFPNLEIKDGSEFCKDYKPYNSIWLSNASNIPYTQKDINPISGLDNRIYGDKNYDIDVYIKFNNWCNKRGWYATTEAYTLMLHKL